MQSRRSFINKSSKAIIALGLAHSIVPTIANSFTSPLEQKNTTFLQQSLSYSFDSLEPYIDKQTMEIHYGKHAASYCKNLNDAFAEELKGKNKTLEDVFKKINKYSLKMRNNGGGHYNHEMFWQCLTPNKNTQPKEDLLNKINQDFGSLDKLKTAFNDAAKSRFGSGWAWLIKDKNNNLKVCSTPNQDNPLMSVSEVKGTPILCLDVWEHAYYLKYQNKRADYINSFWNIINWDYVNSKF